MALRKSGAVAGGAEFWAGVQREIDATGPRELEAYLRGDAGGPQPEPGLEQALLERLLAGLRAVRGG